MLPQETEDYIRESIDHSVGLPVSMNALHHKLSAVEASNVDLRNQYLSLLSKLKEKDEIIERSRAEANMNAVALRKFVEENQRLATECSNLFNKWERECSLYDNDREALMDFANEADERAKEAEIRSNDLEEEKKRLIEELCFHSEEQILLDSLLSTVIDEDEIASIALSFLEAHSGVEICQKLLTMWRSLRPSTQKVVALAAKVKKLEKEKDLTITNLAKAEGEVNAMFEENRLLDEENKKLMRQWYRQKHIGGSAGKKEKSTKRRPLSPLEPNSPESRMHK
ncbi:hypothetical protein ACS0TY_018284 [Phlomoides rotata]